MNTPPRTPPPSQLRQRTIRDDVLLESLRNFHNDASNSDDDDVSNTNTDDKLYDSLMDVYTRLQDDWPLELSFVDFGNDEIEITSISQATTKRSTDDNAPPLFQSPEGRHHLQALMDQCDISQERAISLTFGVLIGLMDDDADNDEDSEENTASDANTDSTNNDDGANSGVENNRELVERVLCWT